MTRYRFFSTPGNSYFGPANGDFTALGRKEAEAYAAGRIRGTAAATAAATARPLCGDGMQDKETQEHAYGR